LSYGRHMPERQVSFIRKRPSTVNYKPRSLAVLKYAEAEKQLAW